MADPRDNIKSVQALYEAFGRLSRMAARRHGKVERFRKSFDTYAAAEAFRP